MAQDNRKRRLSEVPKPTGGDSDRTDPALVAPAARFAPRMPDLGPLRVFMADPHVTEIMVNDLRNVMIQRDGKMMFSGFTFQRSADLYAWVEGILSACGASLSLERPYLDLMLPDGSRVNIVGPPVAVRGPAVTIRKFPTRHFSLEELIGFEMLDARIGYFLNACVIGKANILISGGTDSGKTTLLNALTAIIPKNERLITIEDTPELQTENPNSVRLQTQAAGPDTTGVSARELVANALRMRPDRIIVGECRRAEAMDMLQAMNTGHAGSMTTIHANSPRDALARLETLCLTAATDLPLSAIRKQISSSLDLIVHLRRYRSGVRRVAAVSELTGMEGEVVTMQEIFKFELDPRSTAERELGSFRATGFVPKLIDTLRGNGVEFPRGFFA